MADPPIPILTPSDFQKYLSRKVLFPGFPLIDPPASALPEVSPGAAIGMAADSGEPIRIHDEQRCAGLYILGKPRTGKSTVLISLALSDIENGRGVIFIDPHTDAINDLLDRIPRRREDDVIILDPTHKTHSFGIDLLHCSNFADPSELDKTWYRIRDLFTKVWGDKQSGRLGIWLEKVLRNSVYLLLENREYTLMDIPLLLEEDTTFRDHLLENVTLKLDVKDFWRKDFDRLTKRDKTEQVGPALSRLDIFRSDSTIRNIVGQNGRTLDFHEIIDKQKIVLLCMPVHLDDEVRQLIGTMLLSQLLTAFFERDKLPVKDRKYFGVFCDEFQNFATPDFAKLFTQTGKYKAMPVVAHQERLGQFQHNDPNRGATLGAPNKVLFSLTVHDAQELALEFAEKPPMETRLEQRMVISREPVADLVRSGHWNAEIQAFVDNSLRILYERQEDVKEQMEGERLVAQELRDEAGLHQIHSRMEGADERWNVDYDKMRQNLTKAESALLRASEQTEKLSYLFERGQHVRSTMRALDKFLVNAMEGKVIPGQEAFSDFLIGKMAELPFIPQERLSLLNVYIGLMYGDPAKGRAIPFEFAKKHGFYVAELEAIERAAQEKIKRQKQSYLESCWNSKRCSFKKEMEDAQTIIDKETRCVYLDLVGSVVPYESREVNTYSMLDSFIMLSSYEDVRKLLTPYFNARFTPKWSEQLGNLHALLPKIQGTLKYWRSSREEMRKRILKDKDADFGDCEFYQEFVLKDFEKFLAQYGEGAFVALRLLETIRDPERWRRSLYVHGEEYMDKYLGFNMLYLPAVVDRDPLEILLLVDRLSELATERNYARECVKYFWHGENVGLRLRDEAYAYLQKEGFGTGATRGGAKLADKLLAKRLGYDAYIGRMASHIERKRMRGRHLDGKGLFIKRLEEWDSKTRMRFADQPRRRLQQCEDLDILRRELERYPKRQELYEMAGRNRLVIAYLQHRACDLARFGKEIADMSFPQSRLKGKTEKQVEEMIAWLVSVVQEPGRRKQKEECVRFIVEAEQEIQKDVAAYASRQLIELPNTLSYRVIEAEERERLKQACHKELRESVGGILMMLDELVRFCKLISMPENHVKRASGQYVERQVPGRLESDMVNEKARALSSLPKYTAYATVSQEKAWEQIVWKGKIRSLPLTDPLPDAAERRAVIEKNSKAYYKSREQIEKEIRKRQEKWRSGGSDTAPPRIERIIEREEGDKPPPARC